MKFESVSIIPEILGPVDINKKVAKANVWAKCEICKSFIFTQISIWEVLNFAYAPQMY